MVRILITSGPTRQYLDPVRYLTNASSGRMGAALAAAVLEAGHEAVVVSGPVDVECPCGTELISVTSTEEMLEACLGLFPSCDGLIAAAAPCDYRPVVVASEKIRKTGGPLRLELVETPDVVASLAPIRGPRWMVAFALETEDPRMRALQKLERKSCDLIVVNGPEAMHAEETAIEVIRSGGQSLLQASGRKLDLARKILGVIEDHLIRSAGAGTR